MTSLSDHVNHIVESSILDCLRWHPETNWDENTCWWLGFQMIWGEQGYADAYNRVTESCLNIALRKLGVPESSFRKPGAHTYVDLDNVSFVYRTKIYKDGTRRLLVAPHLKGLKFNQCGHSFISAMGDTQLFARYMLDLDKCIPEARIAARKAFYQGKQEQKVRDIKYQAAGAWLNEFFHGEMPEGYIGYCIADSKPGAMDIIRLAFEKEGSPYNRYFDIPYEFRDFLQMDGVMEFANDPDLRMGSLEMFVDEVTGEKVPVTRYEPFDYVFWEDDNE